MRQAARIDANQPSIVDALRQAGCTVQVLSAVGKGCPDLLCGRAGVNYLLELKDSAKPLSKQKLTPDEMAWHSTWNGLVWTVNSIEDALRVVGAVE
jgi:Holliday junction resolvase